MPAWKERLVEKLRREGKSEKSAWRIATSVENKKKDKKAKRKERKKRGH